MGYAAQASVCCSLTDGAPAIQYPRIEVSIATLQKLWGAGFLASNTTLLVSMLHVHVEASQTCLQAQLAAIQDEGHALVVLVYSVIMPMVLYRQ